MENYKYINHSDVDLTDLLKEESFLLSNRLKSTFNYRQRLENLYGDKYITYVAFLLAHKYRRCRFTRFLYQFTDIIPKIKSKIILGRICPYCGDYFF